MSRFNNCGHDDNDKELDEFNIKIIQGIGYFFLFLISFTLIAEPIVSALNAMQYWKWLSMPFAIASAALLFTRFDSVHIFFSAKLWQPLSRVSCALYNRLLRASKKSLKIGGAGLLLLAIGTVVSNQQAVSGDVRLKLTQYMAQLDISQGYINTVVSDKSAGGYVVDVYLNPKSEYDTDYESLVKTKTNAKAYFVGKFSYLLDEINREKASKLAKDFKSDAALVLKAPEKMVGTFTPHWREGSFSVLSDAALVLKAPEKMVGTFTPHWREGSFLVLSDAAAKQNAELSGLMTFPLVLCLFVGGALILFGTQKKCIVNGYGALIGAMLLSQIFVWGSGTATAYSADKLIPAEVISKEIES